MERQTAHYKDVHSVQKVWLVHNRCSTYYNFNFEGLLKSDFETNTRLVSRFKWGQTENIMN